MKKPVAPFSEVHGSIQQKRPGVEPTAAVCSLLSLWIFATVDVIVVVPDAVGFFNLTLLDFTTDTMLLL